MSKRFATTCFIVLACVLIACFAFVIGLFLLPGVYLFGLKYIGQNTHGGENIAQNNFANGVDASPVYLSVQYDKNGNQLGQFSGIIVNCYEVPVKITFTDSAGHWKIKYKDLYNGITSSKIKDPTIEYEKDESGNIVIDVSEYHTFLYESSVSSRYLELFMPFQSLFEDNVNGFNFEINSYKSPVTFDFEIEQNYSNPATFNNLSIVSNGAVNFNYNVKARTYKLSTSKTIEVNESDKIQATNYDLTSTDGKIVINKDVEGNLTCNTTLGRVLLRNCKNLTCNTTFGDVGYSGDDDGNVTVNGIAKVSTRAGNITLGDVLGESSTNKNSISTTSGNVTIRTIKDATISTQRGKITVDSLRDAEVTSKTGKVYIQEVKTKLVARTTRSAIVVGGDSMLVRDVELYSTLGNIELLSAMGKVSIETISGNIDFTNTSSREIYLNCGGSLLAENLVGDVEIKVEKVVRKIEFDDLTQGNADITLGNKCNSAYVYIDHDSFENVSYMVKGTSVAIQEYKNAEWQGSGTISKNYDWAVSSSPFHFSMIGDNANIVLRFS